MNTKKIIAREGLILLGIIAISLLAKYAIDIYGRIVGFYIKEEWADIPYIFTVLYNLGNILLYLGYPIYLLIRFVIWAIKMLKEKK